MTEKEISELYIRLAFYYESAIGALLAKGVIDADFAIATKERFYDLLDEEKSAHPNIQKNQRLP
ncbi:MAG: hypothetical protein K2N63_13965 [Lachnospiraceae bacterium]|nr:hypothetical protein [Lachnospiraceae bacterium]